MRIFPLRIIGDNTNFGFMKLKNFCFTLSIILCVLSIIISVTLKPNFGIDFTGGTVIEARSDKTPNIAIMREILNDLELGEISIQTFGSENDFMIRIGGGNIPIDNAEIVTKVSETLTKNFDDKFDYRKVDFVGPQVGSYLISSGIQALILSFLAIMIYVWFRFEWQFGFGVLISLIHDVILALGFMCITRLDFNLSSIAAILTIIGYSVNDSVVIYDRIRENLRKYRSKTIDQIIDLSINETLSRTTLTILTTLIANLALILFGGEALKSFSMLVFFGIIIGTYSSIFLSAPILKFLKLEQFK